MDLTLFFFRLPTCGCRLEVADSPIEAASNLSAVRPCSKVHCALGHAPLQRHLSSEASLAGGVSCPPQWVPMLVATVEVDLDAFYSADVDKVAAFLGPEMHFHHGLISAEVDDLLDRSTDAGPALAERSVAERALADALRILYPHVPLGASVLDVGCGWCGPATLLAAERAASVRGVTIARVQAEFCRARRDVPTLHTQT